MSKPAKSPTAHLIEMDDLNLDSAWLTRSSIQPQQLPVGTDAGASIEHIIYGAGLESFVLDIGGNETAKKAIDAIGEQLLFRHFDLIVIPVRDEGQDVDNAVRTIQSIRGHDSNAKIVILLNDITSRVQKVDDLGLREMFAEVFDMAAEFGVEVIVMPRIDRYGRSRFLGMTQWEMAEQSERLIGMLQDQVLTAEAAGDMTAGKLNTRLIRSVTGARQTRVFIDSVHQRLDQILGTDKQRLRLMAVSTKGGVGKSVTSQQLLATYILSRGVSQA
jgi:hypothetical protein